MPRTYFAQPEDGQGTTTGQAIGFSSRAEAEAYARELCEQGAPAAAVFSAPASDPGDCDQEYGAYVRRGTGAEGDPIRVEWQPY